MLSLIRNIVHRLRSYPVPHQDLA
ncbi:hypothetical protein EMIT0P294_240025 [Pseudomonas sp. IT-P294]